MRHPKPGSGLSNLLRAECTVTGKETNACVYTMDQKTNASVDR